jgi:hypothetical protein
VAFCVFSGQTLIIEHARIAGNRRPMRFVTIGVISVLEPQIGCPPLSEKRNGQDFASDFYVLTKKRDPPELRLHVPLPAEINS